MKILVLGGSGFIGINIVRHLIDQGYEVRILHRPNRPPRYLDRNPDVAIGNLDDPDTLTTAMQDCQYVVHAAGYYPRYVFKKRRQIEYAKSQMYNVLNAAFRTGVERLIYISSFATLGEARSENELVNERTPYNPKQFQTTYHQIKYEMEQIILQASGDLPATIFIPTAVIGPYDHKPTTGRIVLDVLNGDLPVYLKGKMNVLAVQDIANAVERAIHRRNALGRFVLGNWNTTLKDFLEMVAQIGRVKAPVFRFPWSIAYLAAYFSEIVSYYILQKKSPLFPVTGLDLLRYGCHVSSEKARSELGFQPSPVSIAIKDAIDWFHDHGYVKKKREHPNKKIVL